jgi:hypothetical protein
MSGKPGKLRSQRVIVLYSEDEFEALRKLYARSTSRTFSAYVRRISLEEPVNIITRNESFDGFVAEIIVLRKVMTDIYQEGRWSSIEQGQLVQIHEEIKSLINKISMLCTPH